MIWLPTCPCSIIIANNLKLRTLRPAKVEVQIAGKSFGPVESTLQTDLSAVVPITGLAPETTYPYRVLVDGKQITIPAGTGPVPACWVSMRI
ncbi:MAG: DUF7800 domain-containing protein [Planctomycetota bacterium]